VAQSIFEWLVTLPPTPLYVVLALTAAIENVIPPFPADLVVAFGSFLVAQGGRGTLTLVAFCTWFGNVAGAMLMYAVGRRYGAERLERRLAGRHAESWDRRIHRMFDRYGTLAVFVSRFVPGVRALVPVVAGAVRAPAIRTALLIGLASAIWYGTITYIAFRVGSNWQMLSQLISRYSTTAGILGAAILGVGVAAWLLVTRRRRIGS
jgi:membrane protein DedA with SNARE-associated domain